MLEGSIAPVGPRDDFEQVSVGVREIKTSPPVIVIDFVGPRLSGICPIRQTTRTYASEHGIKTLVIDEEGVVLRRDFILGLVEIERDLAALPCGPPDVATVCGRPQHCRSRLRTVTSASSMARFDPSGL
jgi:hypothetical protein